MVDSIALQQSYRTINQGGNIRIVGRYIKLPKLGFVKIRQLMEVGKINNVTIERTPTGKYFAVVNDVLTTDKLTKELVDAFV